MYEPECRSGKFEWYSMARFGGGEGLLISGSTGVFLASCRQVRVRCRGFLAFFVSFFVQVFFFDSE